MKTTTTITKIDIALVIAVFLALSTIAFMAFADIHGKYRDTITGKLHSNCVLCTFYRFTHANDAAFAIREAKRNKQ